MECDSFQEGFDDKWFKCLLERRGEVRIEVVENDMDLFCELVSGKFRNTLDRLRKIPFGSSVSHDDISVPAFWFNSKKDINGAVSLVFVIAFPDLLRSRDDRWSGVVEKLFALFIKTDDGFIEIVWFGVELDEMLHPINELLIDGRDTPHFFPATAGCRAR